MTDSPDTAAVAAYKRAGVIWPGHQDEIAAFRGEQTND